MTDHLISSRALIAAEDAYDAIATEHFEQINRCALEKAIQAYLAADPALQTIMAIPGVKATLEQLAAFDDEDKRSENSEDRMYRAGRAAGLRMAAGYLR